MKDIFASYKTKRLQKTAPYFAYFDFLPAKPDIAVVIPSLNEYPEIILTLESLLDSYRFLISAELSENSTTCEIAAKPEKSLKPSAVVIVVINGCSSCSAQSRENNRLTLKVVLSLRSKFSASGLALCVGDCFSAGNEIPENQGVGFARKIGLDLALCAEAKLLTCFDADTLCDKNYFSALASCLPKCVNKKGSPVFFAGLTDFTHQKAEEKSAQIFIDTYENYLKAHSAKLLDCGTPYYPVALGPTLVCSAAAYALCGGMNCRLAGEDFYFLQSLIKVSPDMSIEKINTCVFPSARFSDRVPFGTGGTLEAAHGGNRQIVFFPDSFYSILKNWLSAVEKEIVMCVAEKKPRSFFLIKSALSISPVLHAFLCQEEFEDVWKVIFKNNGKSAQTLRRAFYVWFDGLKIIRLFHRLEENKFAC